MQSLASDSSLKSLKPCMVWLLVPSPYVEFHPIGLLSATLLSPPPLLGSSCLLPLPFQGGLRWARRGLEAPSLHPNFQAEDPGTAAEGWDLRAVKATNEGPPSFSLSALHTAHVLTFRCSVQWNFQLGREKGMYIEAHNSQKNNPAWPHSQARRPWCCQDL